MSKVYRLSFRDVADSEGEKPFSISTGVSTKKTVSRNRSTVSERPNGMGHAGERSRPIGRQAMPCGRPAFAFLPQDGVPKPLESVSIRFSSFVDGARVTAFSDGTVCPSISALEARPPKVGREAGCWRLEVGKDRPPVVCDPCHGRPAADRLSGSESVPRSFGVFVDAAGFSGLFSRHACREKPTVMPGRSVGSFDSHAGSVTRNSHVTSSCCARPATVCWVTSVLSILSAIKISQPSIYSTDCQ